MRKTSDHVTREILKAARRGEIGEAELADLLLAHLEEVCPECRRAIEVERAEEIPLHDYATPVRRARYWKRLRAETERLEEEMHAAPDLLRSLQGLSVGQRLLRIRNTPERFAANRFFCELLFDLARACLPADPAGSQAWAETVEAIARLREEPHMPHVVRALAFQGNARRAVGDFDGALVLLHRARSLMAEHEVAEIELSAELDSFLGSLFSDLRRFDKAAEHLERASRIYHGLGDDEGTARVMMKLSTIACDRGDLESALDTDRAVLQLIGPEHSPRLFMQARFNHAVNLMYAGHFQEARDVLVCDEAVYEEIADDHARIRILWLEGQLAREIGDLQDAEATLTAVRDHFIAQEHGFNCALVCLDLALLYHREARWPELHDVAAQAVRLFQSYAFHQDGPTALVLLRDAAAAERATAETIERAASFLHTAPWDPKARLDMPG